MGETALNFDRTQSETEPCPKLVTGFRNSLASEYARR